MRALLLTLELVALASLAGCQRSDDFKTGSKLYSKTNHAYAGKIIGFEARHDFGQGVVTQGAQVQTGDGKSIWVRVDQLGDRYAGQ